MLGSRKKLSEKQGHILEFIRTFLQEHPYPPSVRDIQGGCSISSTSVVDYNLRLLQRAGLIRRSPEISRGIELVGARPRQAPASANVTIPVIGYVAAGEPLPVFPDSFQGEPMETLELPASMLPRGRQVFALRVKGHSMIDALIDDGDIVLLEPTHEARNGEMVVAWLKEEKEATLKRIYREGSRVRLQPANSQMQAIHVAAENVEVQGRVVGAIRILA
jgi:repressor LexA